ncbi:hypothetical protein [Streptomyces griseoaurantiacus]|uniref:hypothetical protein n=1 Tax=Streptomyces griseoaurantiacus TaxID=68213 RepID=UPI0036AE6C60
MVAESADGTAPGLGCTKESSAVGPDKPHKVASAECGLLFSILVVLPAAGAGVLFADASNVKILLLSTTL